MIIRAVLESLRLKTTPNIACHNTLGYLEPEALSSLLNANVELLEQDQVPLNSFNLPEMSGGVNPGDQKAIHQLISGLRPRVILEVGTHIGCSTINIALAMRRYRTAENDPPQLWTVDIYNVNDETSKPWVKHGSANSPQENIRKIPDIANYVTFVTQDSISFLANTELSFDFIFLDGSHAAAQVYREIPLALSKLRAGGFILLHDYFPSLKPLWADSEVIRGPFLALQRLKKEGLQVCELPFGVLPWPTKLNSNISSLCLLSRCAP
jgi:predicted O-methyltransferase YrrM